MYDKRDGFNFEILNSHYVMEIFLALLPMVYIFLSLLVSNIDDFNNRNLFFDCKGIKTKL